MNQSSDSWETRLDELVAAMRDDSLSDEQSVDLQNLLQTQLGARRRFAESMHLSAMLSDGVQVNEPIVTSLKSVSDAAGGTRRFRAIATILLATSATILFALLWARPQGDHGLTY